MTKEEILEKLESLILKAHESGDKYDFIDDAYDLTDEIEERENNIEFVEPILKLIERSPNIDFGGPGPLGSFIELHYKKGYEEILVESLNRKPTEYTIFLLHRLINDKANPKRKTYLELLKVIAENPGLDSEITENAKESLTYFE
ncbi:hypothetical protein FUAX_05190 [Fulvitalea axinellae]|uniref:Immunity protein 30 domain-containing protein n=1 Tax=Fulvitalea axinellae TaxID=1182444 RepID=A0AAU9CML1_9BACT|nr:hypothetical protein FUAX_05190 [Fulvitalea axinellae]